MGNEKIKIYNELVRDKIPKIIQASGKQCDVRAAGSEEYYKLLEHKLQEEVNEFLKDKNLEELADVMEVVIGLANVMGYSEEELIKKRVEKKNERGGFSEGIVLLNVRE